MNRNQLRTILKINGLSEDASDDEIRAVLVHARYSENEIESALVILQEAGELPNPQTVGLHSVMYTGNTLRANEVVSLLGVDMNVDLPISFRSKHARIETFDGLLIIGGAILLATLGVVLYMYLFQVGFFYPTIDSF